MYDIKKENIADGINLILAESIDEELMYRYDKYISNEEIKLQSTPEALSDTVQTKESGILNPEEVIETSLFQQILNIMGYPVQISFIDSVFQIKFNKLNHLNEYLLVYKDSTKTIIEQTGNLMENKTADAFHSESYLIVDGKRLQTIVDISPSAVFLNMMWLLLASDLILIIIIICIIYQAKTIFTQYKLNQLREDFTHALTHDMKTPLGTINGVLSQFRNGSLDDKPDKKEKFGKIAMDQVSGLLALVEKILTIAKLEEGKPVLERTIINLSEIINELKNRFAISKGKNVIIHHTTDLITNVYIWTRH